MSTVQYTIRGIPSDVDIMIRKRAKREGKSFNKTVVDLLEKSLFTKIAANKSENFFKDFVGSNTIDEYFDEALDAQSQVDESLWI
jgi:hypothetical protein